MLSQFRCYHKRQFWILNQSQLKVPRSALIYLTVSNAIKKGERTGVKADVNEKYDKKIKITSVNLLESLILYRSKWSISLKEVLLTIKSASG